MTTQVDWKTEQAVDPRLPTDPSYVFAGALARQYQIDVEILAELAEKNPHWCRTSAGNPWTKTDGAEKLFIHEPLLLAHLESRRS